MDTASTIGRGTFVRGSVRGDGDLEILGRVEGSVEVSGELSVGEGALVKSDVSGRRVVVRGAVAGNVSATETIVLEAGARVLGDLGAPQIGIRPGALVRGHVSTAGPLDAAGRVTAPARGQKHAPPALARGVAPAPRAAPARPAVPPPRPAPPPVAARAIPAPVTRHAGHVGARGEAPTLASARVEPSRALEIEAVDSAAEHLEQDLPIDVGAVGTMAGPGAEAEEAGGPPPPVVPTIRKGQKAQLRKKGAR